MSRNLNAQHKKQHKHESGQAIIIIAVVMVGLMGMLGMAIDGGGLYVLHRDTQNAVDAALVAATYAQCAGSSPSAANIIQAGLQAASLNGFDNGVNGTVVTINPFYAPDEGGSDNYVEVIIEATKPSYFIQLVYPEPLKVTTRGVGYCKPSTISLLPGDNALIALRSTHTGCNMGQEFAVGNSGTGDMRVHNSGIFSNSPHSSCAIDRRGSGTLEVLHGPCTAVGGFTQSPPSFYCQGYVKNHAPLASANPLADLERPQCGPERTASGTVYQPGTYNSISPNNTDITLLPGIYCIRNDFDIKRGVTGSGVIIYMYPGNSGSKMNANARLDISAPTADNCIPDVTCPFIGLLWWSDVVTYEGNVIENGDLHINGGADTGPIGFVYSPGSQCIFNGGGKNVFTGVVACHSVRYNGNAAIDIYFEFPEFLNQPPYVGIAE